MEGSSMKNASPPATVNIADLLSVDKFSTLILNLIRYFACMESMQDQDQGIKNRDALKWKGRILRIQKDSPRKTAYLATTWRW